MQKNVTLEVIHMKWFLQEKNTLMRSSWSMHELLIISISEFGKKSDRFVPITVMRVLSINVSKEGKRNTPKNTDVSFAALCWLTWSKNPLLNQFYGSHSCIISFYTNVYPFALTFSVHCVVLAPLLCFRRLCGRPLSQRRHLHWPRREDQMSVLANIWRRLVSDRWALCCFYKTGSSLTLRH